MCRSLYLKQFRSNYLNAWEWIMLTMSKIPAFVNCDRAWCTQINKLWCQELLVYKIRNSLTPLPLKIETTVESREINNHNSMMSILPFHLQSELNFQFIWMNKLPFLICLCFYKNVFPTYLFSWILSLSTPHVLKIRDKWSGLFV